MKRNVLFGEKGREKLLEGINIVADAAKVTLGARGRNVIIKQDFGLPPHITKDGVTVARHIELNDDVLNMGATLMKEVANKTADMAGDGTTTSLVLAQALIMGGVKLLKESSPMEIKTGMEKAGQEIVQKIQEISRPVNSFEDLLNIATVSANGDESIGKLIAETMQKVGKEGSVAIEETVKRESYVDVISGMPFESGYVSQYFVTNPAKMRCELENPLILIYTKKILDMKDMVSIMEHTQVEKRPLLVISEELGYAALATFAGNKQRGLISGCAVRIPEIGEAKGYAVNDLAAYTGATVVSEELGYKLDNLPYSVFGTAEKVIIDKNKTTIIGGKGEYLAKQIETINHDIEAASGNLHEKKFHQNRLAKLNNGVAVIYVGGFTGTEIKEKKDRVDDAVCATRSAMEEGIVAGAGTTLLHISNQMESDGNKGYELVKECLCSPFEQILTNAGIGEYQNLGYGNGINVKTGKEADLFAEGIIDPAKVVRVCVENAISIASIFLTTECIISEDRP
jgi:chaperonin GroEL